MSDFARVVRERLDQVIAGLRRRIRRRPSEQQIFLVYSMGKVGSTTVHGLLSREQPPLIAHGIHFLSERWVKEILPASHRHFHQNIQAAQDVYESLASHPTHRVKIITLVRDPLAREISNIFENWRGYFGADSIEAVPMEQLARHLDGHTHEYVLNWFDTEFKAYTGFDVFSHPFDRELGYTIYSTPRADILCLQLEKLDARFPEAIGRFAGLSITMTGMSNRSELKDGRDKYDLLNRTYKASFDKLRMLYTSKLVRHFYSEAAIDGLVARWSRGEFRYQHQSVTPARAS